MSYQPNNPNSQATMANSAPVVVASDQTPITIDTENSTLKDNFPGTTLDTTKWTVNQASGSATTYAITSSVLAINAQTTANDWIAFTSNQGFTLPFRVQVILQISQRIANNNFYVEVVNAAGALVANLGSIVVEPGVTQAAYLFNGTTNTTGAVVAQNQGFKATADTNVGVNATSGYQTIDMECRTEDVDYAVRVTDAAGQQTSSSQMRSRSVLDPNETYYMQIRSVNGGTAPASNTTLSVEVVLVQDATRTVMEISGGRGNYAADKAVPVAVISNINVNPVPISRSATVTGSPSVDVSFGTVVTHESKSSSANLFSFDFVSLDTTQDVYLQFFNATSATGTPIYSFLVQKAGTLGDQTRLNLGADFFGIPGKNFSTALTWGISTTKGTYTAAATAANYIVNINYL
jgi:hypothetical protein